jgi:hypothetical protein
MWILLCIFWEFKHYLADWHFQTAWISSGKRLPGLDWIYPLTLHAGLHSVLSLTLLLIIAPVLWYLALIDFGTHFAMDAIKARLLAPVLPGWICLLIDQSIHHAVHFWIVYKVWQVI